MLEMSTQRGAAEILSLTLCGGKHSTTPHSTPHHIYHPNYHGLQAKEHILCTDACVPHSQYHEL